MFLYLSIYLSISISLPPYPLLFLSSPVLVFLHVVPARGLLARTRNKLRSILFFSRATLLLSPEQSRATRERRQICFRGGVRRRSPMKKRASTETQERDGWSSKYHLDLSIIIPPRRSVPRRAGATSLPSEWISLRIFLQLRSPVATH